MAGVHDPVLQLDQLGLQAEQLMEILAPAFLFLLAAGGRGQQRVGIEVAVVELQLELFVVAVGEIALHALGEVGGLDGRHGGLLWKRMMDGERSIPV